MRVLGLILALLVVGCAGTSPSPHFASSGLRTPDPDDKVCYLVRHDGNFKCLCPESEEARFDPYNCVPEERPAQGGMTR